MATHQMEQEAFQAGQEAARRMSDQMAQTTRTMADAGERTARMGAELMQRNSENMRTAMQSGTELATKLTERSLDQFTRACGLTGDNAQHTMEQSSRNVQVMMETGALLAQGAQNVSGEWLNFTQTRAGRNLDRLDALLGCRTIGDMMAVQTALVRDSLEDFLQSARRTSEMTTRIADEAVRKMTDASLAPR